MTDRCQLLEAFRAAIHDLWRWQHVLGQAHARGASPAERLVIDRRLGPAMRWVATLDEALKRDT